MLSDQRYGLPDNNSDTETTPVDRDVDVAVTKTTTDAAIAGGSLTYTIAVTNNGPGVARGISVTDIGSTLEMLLGGRVVTRFKRGTKQYDVIAQMKPSGRATPDVIDGLYLRSNGGLVQLASVVNVRETVAPKELNHFNRVRSAKVTASLAPGVGLGQALDDLDAIARAALPTNVKRELAGRSLEYKTSSSSLYYMFILAVAFVFLVLAAAGIYMEVQNPGMIVPGAVGLVDSWLPRPGP